MSTLTLEQPRARRKRTSGLLPDAISVDGTVRARNNSRGMPIHATLEGIENFWRWFGDSLAVDALGRPLVLYHGTLCWERDGRSLGDVEAFDRLASVRIVRRRPSIDTIGVWCSNMPGETGAGKYAFDGAIYPLYARVTDAYTTTFERMVTRTRRLAGMADGDLIGEAGVNALRYWLTETARDAIWITGSSTSTEFAEQHAWIVLDGSQLKSATGNSGAFSPNSPHITA